MAHAIWKGQLSFGLLNIPVSLYSAENRTDVQFRLLDSRDKSRVKYERVNIDTGEEVPWDEVVKAYEYDKGNYVVIDEDELKELMPEATQSVDLETFVKNDSLPHIYFDKPYYLVPQKKYEKGYVLLREALHETNSVGIARVVIRTRGYLAAVMPYNKALILNLIRYPQEIKSAEEFNLPEGSLDKYKVSKKEVDMSKQLIEAMTAEWNPEDYHDEYREKLMSYIEEKIKTTTKTSKKKSKKDDEEVTASNVVDMMDVLKKSLDKKKKPTKPKSDKGSKSGKRKSS